MIERSLFAIFMEWLTDLGGSYTRISNDKPAKLKEWKDTPEWRARYEWRHRLRFTKRMQESYAETADGVLRRVQPKRDKSISARQSKIRTKAARREAKLQECEAAL